MAKSSFIATTIAAFRHSPREIFNWYLFMCTCIWSFPGVAKGFDEGNIASLVVMDTFKIRFGLNTQSDEEYANTKGWIVSIATAGAVFGCLACMALTVRSGRRVILQVFTLVYVGGVLGQTFCGGNLSGLYASRFITGIAIGATTVLPSIYLSEIAPRSIRGLLTLQYACCQQLGVVFGFFFVYGITKSYAGTQTQWQLPTALQILPAVIWGVGTFFTLESPRYLISNGQLSEGLATLCRLRNLPDDHSYIQEELRGIQAQVEQEAEIVAGANSLDLFKETFLDLKNRRRFFLMFFAHLFSQWSGANAITQYSPSIFGYLGITGEESRFLATGLYAIVKFVSTFFVSIFVIDFIGRRRSLITGICGQIITLTFVGAYLGITNGRSSSGIATDPSAKRASEAAIAAIYLHAISWSVGWFSIPYLVSSEVFPIRIRSFNVSILMAFHWAFYFGCSRAMPSLLVATQRYGAFAFFAGMCTLSLGFVLLAMPETAGRSLESMDSLFDRPWYTVWKVAYPKSNELTETSTEAAYGDKKKPHIEEDA